jgi:two-component system cell cycle response regulator
VKRILIVDDDRENIELLSKYLSQEAHTIQSAAEGEAAMHRVRAWRPHLILLDINMPGVSGVELVPRIRHATSDEYTPIALVSGNIGIDDVAKGMQAGADEYLTKPFRPQELLSRVRALLKLKDVHDSLRRANHRIEELTSTDDLTGLMNMRALYKRGEEEISRAKRFKKPLSVLFVNLDGFSSINRSHGFIFGSHLLQEVGHRLKRCLRSIDLAARIGADEFFVVLVETDLAGAEYMAERIRDAISATPITNDKITAQVTACVGVAGIAHQPPIQGQRMSELLNTSFEALRSAKSAGPNHIEVYSFA